MKCMRILFVLFTAVFPTHAEFHVSPMFGDHAVLQRGVAVPVTGRGTPGDTVTVAFVGQRKTGIVADDGSWRVTLEPLSLSNQPATMTVTSTDGADMTFEDMLVGDVWFASGQSNMGFGYNASLKPDEPFEDEKNASIRFFSTTPEFYPLPRESFSKPTQWEVATHASIQWQPAVAWFFAREIRKRVDVPIGIIVVARGGTMIQPFMPIESHADLTGKDRYPSLARLLDDLQARDPSTEAGQKAYRERLAQIGRWNETLPASTERGSFPSPIPSLTGSGQNTDCGIYNACIHPFREFPFKGMLWYQGESNGGDGEIYYHLLKAMIGSLRKQLSSGEFPVYVVQLAPYGQDKLIPGAGDGSSGVRESQRQVCRDIPNTGLVVTLDIGDSKDIHPRNKVDVGKRLARWALNRDYGFEEILPSGPLFREQEVQGNRIILHFDYVGSGLMVGVKAGLEPVKTVSAPMDLFAISGEDRKFVRAQAAIVDGTVVVTSLEVPEPRYVRYAYSASPSGPLLYNREGIPASSFKTDPW